MTPNHSIERTSSAAGRVERQAALSYRVLRLGDEFGRQG